MQCPRPDEFACLGSARPESVAQAAASKLNPAWCGPQATWRQRQRFGAWARRLIRLPEAGEDPFQVLLGEAEWQTLLPPAAAGEIVLTALSQETGIYFFPTREWVGRCCRLLQLLKVRRVLEAGAGRGYLAAALAARLATDGLAFLAVDNGQGDFESGLPRHSLVQQGEARAAARTFGPEFILYAWPPPGQSIAPLLASPGVRFVLVVGEAGGGCTGDPGDWLTLPHRELRSLSRLGYGRSGRSQQAATLFIREKGQENYADPHY